MARCTLVGQVNRSPLKKNMCWTLGMTTTLPSKFSLVAILAQVLFLIDDHILTPYKRCVCVSTLSWLQSSKPALISTQARCGEGHVQKDVDLP
eukprot:3135450-Amphidinium_carterae.1